MLVESDGNAFLYLATNQNTGPDKAKLISYSDSLCGWCEHVWTSGWDDTQILLIPQTTNDSNAQSGNGPDALVRGIKF